MIVQAPRQKEWEWPPLRRARPPRARATSSRAVCWRSAAATPSAPAGSARTPTTAPATAVIAYNLTTGKIRGVDVSGLTLVGVVHIPGNILEGNWRNACSWTTARRTSRWTRCSTLQRQARRPACRPRQLVGELVSVERRQDRALDRRRRRHAERGRQDRLRDAPLPRPRRKHHHAQQLDLLHGSGLAGLRGEWPTTSGSTSPSTATSGSSRARTRSSPTGRSTTEANDRACPGRSWSG